MLAVIVIEEENESDEEHDIVKDRAVETVELFVDEKDVVKVVETVGEIDNEWLEVDVNEFVRVSEVLVVEDKVGVDEIVFV
jgi:hypothetical protein